MDALKSVNLHPEFVLSRRELIRYVLSEPGQRSKEVQSLLRLDEIEKLRGVLQKISKDFARNVPILERAETDALHSLLTGLNIPELKDEDVLSAVNLHRRALGLPPLTNFDPTISVKDGMTAAASKAICRVPKAQAVSDLSLLSEAISAQKHASFKKDCMTAYENAAELEKDSDCLDGLSREALLKSSLELFDGSECPVCDTPFESEQFTKRVKEKLARFDSLAKRRKAFENKIKPILDTVHATGTALKAMIEYSTKFSPAIGTNIMSEYRDALRENYLQLEKLLPIDATRAALLSLPSVPDVSREVDALKAAISAIPEPTQQDAARDYLVLAQERLELYWISQKKVREARQKSAVAAKVFDIYAKVSTEALERIYKDVEAEFSVLYRKINEDDENSFTAKLLPSIGKLGFDVDFYGRGHFPPGAYHSEGHQDGMGLCLYLALMNHLLGKNFSFAVLDDVLMSVDSGHRRQVCSLLKEKFPNTQFFFTTHDEIWLRHMVSESLIKGKCFVHFRKWTVDLGPTEWDNRDVWTEVDQYLEKSDVRSAAALLRHYLEYFSKDACDRLRAKVEFRGDAQFTLGDLLPNATNALGETFKKASNAANSWGLKEVIEAIKGLETKFVQAKQKTNYDRWQLNAAVHFNEWANLSKNDFAPVVSAFKSFVECFFCEKCNGMFYIVPDRGARESAKCPCGSLSLNLLEKDSK